MLEQTPQQLGATLRRRFSNLDPRSATIVILSGAILYAGCAISGRRGLVEELGMLMAFGLLGVGMIMLFLASIASKPED